MPSDNPVIIPGDDDELRDPMLIRPERPMAAPVGAATARGFYWQSTLALAMKLVSTASQIVLSWFVINKDFGLVATSTAIASFIWLIQDAGLTQILIKRQRRYAMWCTPIFWLAMTLALISASLTAGSGWLAAHVMHQRALIGLMVLLAIRGFASAPSAIPLAKLSINMRFGLLAIIGFSLVTLERSLMVLFTSPLFRWGAYGFIVAMMIVSGVRSAVMWWFARPPVQMEPKVRRWKFVFRDSWLLTSAQAFQVITVYGDNLLLALFRSQEIVGDYYWAYNLSLQTTMLLTSSLGAVLFPALSKLQREPERMRKGFIRAARMLTMVGVPGCLLQAALARPAVMLVFGNRWLTAVPALQVLSLGMAMGLLNYPALGLLRAQGRFSTERTLSGICAGLFLIAAVLGALLGGSLSMAIAVAIYNIVAGLLYVRSSLGPDWRRIFSIYFLPCVLSVLAIGAGYLCGDAIKLTSRAHCAAQIVLVTGIGMPIYLIAARWLMPDLWAEAMVHARPILRRLGWA